MPQEIERAFYELEQLQFDKDADDKIIELRKLRNEADNAGQTERSRDLHNQAKEFQT